MEIFVEDTRWKMNKESKLKIETKESKKSTRCKNRKGDKKIPYEIYEKTITVTYFFLFIITLNS